MLAPGSSLQETVCGLNPAPRRSKIQVSYFQIAYLAFTTAFIKNLIFYIQQHTKSILRKIAHFVPVFPRFRWSCKYTTLDGKRQVARSSALI
jgi:hypothetical protein